MIIIITYFLFLCLALAALILIGQWLGSLMKLDNTIAFHHTVFRGSLLGMIAAVSIYAMMMTFGKTILSGLILLLIVFLFFRKRNEPIKTNTSFKFSWKKLGFILLPLIVFFGWKISYVLGVDFTVPNVINADDLCHVQRAMYFNQFGIETADLNYLQIPNGVQPFHYFESWQIAFFQKISQGNFWLCEQLIVIPMTCSMIFYGVVTVLKNFELNKYVMAFAVITAIGGAIYLPQFVEISFFKWTGAFNSNPFTEYWAMKYGILYLIVINFIIVYLRGSKKWAIISLLSLPIFSITLAPSILLAVFIILVYAKIKKTLAINWIELLLPLLIGSFIIVFYSLFKSTTVFIEIPRASSVIGDFFVPDNIKRNLILMAEKTIHVGAFYWPYILIYFLLKRSSKFSSVPAKELIRSFGILLFVTAVSLPMWPLFYSTFGSSEFFNYPSIAIFNIIGSILFLYFIGKNNNAVLFGLGSVITIFFIYKTVITNKNFHHESTKQMYSQEYLEEIYNYKHLFVGVAGGIINEKEKYQTGHHYNSNGYYVYGFCEDPCYNISLSRHFETLPSDLSIQHELFARTSPFFRFVENLKSKGLFTSINDAQLRCIKEYQLNYLVIYPESTIPQHIQSLIDTTLIDNKSGERFVILKD